MSGLRESLRRKRAVGDGPGELVDRALRRIPRDELVTEADVRRFPEVRAIVAAPDEVRRECVLRLVPVALDFDGWGPRQLLSIAARKRLPFTADDAASVLRLALGTVTEGDGFRDAWAATEVLRPLAAHVERAFEAADEADRARLRPLVEAAAEASQDTKTTQRFVKLLGARAGDLSIDLIAGDDDVGPRLRAVFAAATEDAAALDSLLRLLAAYPQSGKASRTWLREARRSAEALTDPSALASALLEAALAADDTHGSYAFGGDEYETVQFLDPRNEPLVCGIATFAGGLADPGLLPALRRLAAKSVTVIGGQFGSPRSLRLANASAHAIAASETPAAITELLALERAVRHGTLLREIRKAIDGLAAAQGVTRGELLEQAVERHGLDDDGTRTVPLANGHALVEVDARSARLAYVDGGGKRRGSVPSAVKESDAEVLAGLRDDLKAVRKTLAGERNRLDGLLAEARSWPVDRWRALYLDHPITGRLARALIWTFRSPDCGDLVGVPVDGETISGADGTTIPVPRDGEVRLWHPVEADPSAVAAWRAALFERELVQPVKQAFREVYVVTPAEEQTEVYSNRFAGHVFQQVQARALMKGRGWSPVALAWWDDGIDHGVARRVFEPHGVRAEFFFDPIVDIDPQTTDLYPYCTSDQVRFFDDASERVIPVREVPRLVLSEAMRDVDLFVTVTSIGADPEWLDRGEGRHFRTYWHEYGFGRLSAGAEIRREVLEQLVPRLAVADRLELEKRYLVVRGDVRTYRIHLGSGNVLMSPNDQYLCIVAARGARTSKLFLPFDDDPVLSLILSKAFLLADDTAITDRTILRQIRP